MGNSNDAAATGLGLAFVGGYLFVWLAVAVLMVVAQWKVFSKAGFNGALGLLMLVPCVNMIVWLWFAFTEWPIEQQLRSMGGGGTTGASPYYRPEGGGAPPPPQV
jgi:hypothetical protein